MLRICVYVSTKQITNFFSFYVYTILKAIFKIKMKERELKKLVTDEIQEIQTQARN